MILGNYGQNQEESMKKGYLVLQDGRVFEGIRFGAQLDAVGELVFNMLVLTGTVKLSDRVVHEMLGV